MTGTEILVTALGGITLLLWGCRMVRTGVIRAYGSELQRFIGSWSGNRVKAAIAGAGVGTALQSSTATALLVSAFVGQGAIAATAALAVMLGADLGSAIAASIFSSGVSAAWPVLAFGGYVIHSAYDGRSVRVKNLGRILLGLGLLFLGLRVIGTASADLSASPIVTQIISATSHEPVLALLLGAALTWIAYSSIAIVLLAVALAGAGGVSAEHLFPMLLGVNIGAALPALSATLGEPPAVRRIPLGNLLFRLCGVMAALPFLTPATELIVGLTTNAAHQVVLFHLAFNAILCVVFVGLTGPAAWCTQRLLPDLGESETAIGPRFLDVAFLETPAAALAAASRETLRIGDLIEEMLAKSMQVFETDDRLLQAEVVALDDQVDELNEAVKLYLTRLMRDELTEKDSERAVDILSFTTNLEHVGDIVDMNLMELADKKRKHRLHFPDQGLSEIRTMHARVMDTLHLSLNVFMSEQADSARELIARKSELRSLELEGMEKHIERLTSGQVETLVTSAIHVDVIRDFKRINSHLTSVAYPVLERAGELRQTRLKKKSERQIKARVVTGSS